MTVDKFLNKWYDKEIEDWGGETSPEYRNFQTNYKSVIKDFCKDIGMELHSFSKNHYEFSAVVKSNTTNQFYYIDIFHFVVTADIINFAHSAVVNNKIYCFAMILNIKPIAHIFALAVNGKRLIIQCIRYHKRNKLFWEMIRPVVV